MANHTPLLILLIPVISGVLLMIPVVVEDHVLHRQSPWVGSLLVIISGGWGLILRRSMAHPLDLRHLPVPRWVLPLGRHLALAAVTSLWWILLAAGGILASFDPQTAVLTCWLRWATFTCWAITAAVVAAQWPGGLAAVLVLAAAIGAWVHHVNLPDLGLLVAAILLMGLALTHRPAQPPVPEGRSTPPLGILRLQVLAVREGSLIQALLVLSSLVLVLVGGASWVSGLPPSGVLPGGLLILATVVLIAQGWARLVEGWFDRRAELFAYLPVTELRPVRAAYAVPLGVAVVCLIVMASIGLHQGRTMVDVLWLGCCGSVLTATNLMLLVKVRYTGLLSAFMFSIIFIRVVSHVQPPLP